ncbi:oxidoreductase [Candidatus Woesearchaeota archaeon]|nr:oxidoreductase [Candidatus Woesearchaeota archaeon]
MNWTVEYIKKETPTTITLHFTTEKEISFQAGQWYLFDAIIDEKKIKRAYSISSAPSKNEADVTVTLVENGIFSTYLHSLQPGDTINAEGPYGRFIIDEDATELVLIGAGSGIAPLMSIIRTIIKKNLDIKVTLLYSSKTQENIIFYNELTQLSKRETIHVHHTLTVEQWNGMTGRINKDKIEHLVTDFSTPTFYICGPPLMVNAVQHILLEKNVEAQRIKTERYH